MIIAIDFDGTVVTHAYPAVGEDIGAVDVLRDLVAAGHSLLLLTMRGGLTLADAIRWFDENDIKLWAVNINPQQHRWSNSRKVYAHLYIDDAALGVPLVSPEGQRPFVDWKAVHEMLEARGLFKRSDD